jgi:hypothetical protein
VPSQSGTSLTVVGERQRVNGRVVLVHGSDLADRLNAVDARELGWAVMVRRIAVVVAQSTDRIRRVPVSGGVVS